MAQTLRNFFAIRPAEQRNAWTAFFVLFGIVASLSVLETARDTLFLSRVPAARLPWMYISLAVLSLAVANLQSRFSFRGGRASLATWTFVSAVVTLGLARFLRTLGTGGVYAIYVWTGLSSTLVIVRFWTLLASRFTVTQAKRLYGLIGAGSVLGAIVGSAVARTSASSMGPRHLVSIAGIGFAVTALLPLFFTSEMGRPVEEKDETFGSLKGSVHYMARQPYALRLVLAMSVSTACVTVGDYLFKSTAAATVPREELGVWFATVYLFLNVGSLVAQIALTGWLTRRLSVPAAFSVLPMLLCAGGVGMLAATGIVAALAIKAADGTLRYSLHKTCSEMLFLPFNDAERQRVKAFIDVVGQRGGQTAASILVLGVAGLRHSVQLISFGLIALALAWMASAASLRRGYLGLFRRRLDPLRLEHLEAFPELDLASLETLLATLDSERSEAVLAALDALEAEGKVHLIPALILYHPTEGVVERALAIFARARRSSVVPVIDRLLDHPNARVRAAALAARSVLDPDPEPLFARADVDESPEVRATIAVNLIASGAIHGSDARERTRAILDQGKPQVKVALAEAIERRGAKDFADELVELSRDHEVDVRVAAARAMASLREQRFIPPAIDLLPDEHTRPLAKAILVGLGRGALDAIVSALGEPERSPTLRWRMAQIIAAFDHRAATAALLTLLPREDDGAVRFQIIRGLEAIVRRHPDVSLDRAVLDDAIGATVRRAYRYLARRAVLERGRRDAPHRATAGHKLLTRVLDDKARNATDRLFRLLGLAYPLEDFVQIYRGIIGGRRDARAGAMELVANVLPAPLRGAVIGLVDDIGDEERLAAAGPYREKVASEYVALLGELLGSTSESVRSVTVFHVGELRLTQFVKVIEGMMTTGPLAEATGLSDAARAMARLSLANEATP